MYKILIQNEDVEERAILFDLLQEFDEEFELYETKRIEETMRIIHSKNIQIVITDTKVNMPEAFEQFPNLEFVLFGNADEIFYAENVSYVERPIQKVKLKLKFTEVIRRLVKKEIVHQVGDNQDQVNADEHAIETKISVDKDENRMKEIRTAISLKNGVMLREKPASILSYYREMDEQYTYYVRGVCLAILQLFVKTVPSKMSEIEKMAEFIFDTKEYAKVESLLRSYAELVVEEFESEASSSNRVIYQVKQYIDLHYHEDLKLSRLAEQVYLSSNYLSNIFTKHTGCSLNKYIKEVRLEKAQELLLSTNMKVADIGQRVGYDNTSYFIKKFQEKYGMTPEKYRMKPAEQEDIWNIKN